MDTSIVTVLKLAGATSPTKAMTTEQVIKFVNDPNCLVYRQLVNDPAVKRVDLEGNETAPVLNGWHI